MELDLALDREGVTLQPSDSSDLLDETAWLQQLEHWLNGICGDASLDCPTSVSYTHLTLPTICSV